MLGSMTEHLRKRPLPKTSKLSDEQALELIRRVHAQEITQAAAAREYGVTPAAITYIIQGKRRSLAPPKPLPETKRCYDCGKTKPLNEFYGDPRCRDGKKSECKTCANRRSGEGARKLPNERRLLRGAKYRAQELGLPFNLVEEDILIPSHCPILGVKLARGDGQAGDWSPSLDKIIPSAGYIRGNVQVISYKANAMKRDATTDELRRFAKWVLENLDGE